MNFGRQKCGATEIKQCQLVIRPDVGVLWVGQDGFLQSIKRSKLSIIL